MSNILRGNKLYGLIRLALCEGSLCFDPGDTALMSQQGEVQGTVVCLQADFSFFFDTGGRRRCYIAPERLYTSDTPDAEALSNASLHPSMVNSYLPQSDTSCGCAISLAIKPKVFEQKFENLSATASRVFSPDCY